MLNFDDARFLSIQRGAVALAPRIDAAISAALTGGAENLFFLGTGGVAYLMEPAIQLLQCNSSFPVFRDYPAEILTSGNSNLTSRSIVIMPSLSGTTKESVAMLDRLKEIGAQVITLIGHADTPLGFGGNPALVKFSRKTASQYVASEKDGKPSNFYKATFEVRYKKGDTWKSTDNYSLRDLQNLWKANALAHSAILKLVREDASAAPEVEDEAA